MKSSRENYLTAILDYFTHPSLRTDSDQYYRARILIGALLIFSMVPPIAFSIVLNKHLFPHPVSTLYAGIICWPTTICFSGLVILLRQKGNFQFCSIAAVFIMLISLVTGISVSGGPAVSPVVQLMVLPPLAAYFFGGLRWGRIVVNTAFMILVVLYALNMVGFKYIQTNFGDDVKYTQMIVNLLNFFVISSMAFIYETISETLKKERDIEYKKYIGLAKIDPLTGLANRRNFDEMLQDRVRIYGAENPPRRFALGYLDLDGFKPINDQYGHAVGDEVLLAVSDRLRAALRASDFVGRHGGDEFLLVLDMVGDQSSLEAMAQRILNSIAVPIETTAGPVNVSGSLGFAMYPLDSAEIEGLKKSADAAMYEAKRQHGTWIFYRPGM